MLRHEFTAGLCRRLGLVDGDAWDSLYAEYLQALSSEPRGAPYLTWEAWGFSIGLFDPNSLATLTRAFNQANFRCGACGKTSHGGQLRETPVITCPACGDTASIQLMPEAVGPPGGQPPAGQRPAPAPMPGQSIASTVPGVRSAP
ncbi:MAG: hypothetical protein AB7K09_19330, partial [Planctomycetota bacterium]